MCAPRLPLPLPLRQPAITDAPDFTSLTSVCDRSFATAQFEWQNPSAMYITTMKQAANGTFARSGTAPVDFSAWGGLWINCAGEEGSSGFRV